MNVAMKITLKKAISYSLIASFYTSLSLLAATNATAGQEAYPSDKGCDGDPATGAGGKCYLTYINNTNLVIQRTPPSKNEALVSPITIAPGVQKTFVIGSNNIDIPPHSMPVYCNRWDIVYTVRYHFFDQKEDKGYCDIRYRSVCGWDKDGETYRWFTAFSTIGDTVSCDPKSASSVKLTATPLGQFSADSGGEYYTGFTFTFEKR